MGILLESKWNALVSVMLIKVPRHDFFGWFISKVKLNYIIYIKKLKSRIKESWSK